MIEQADILLINLEINASEPCGLNLGLASIAGAIVSRGMSCYQTCVGSELDLKQLGSTVRRLAVKIAGISVVDSQIAALPDVAKILRANGVLFVCVGGAAPTLEPSAFCGFTGIDVVLRGEGELLFPELCEIILTQGVSQALSSKKLHRIPGLRAAVTEPQKVEDPFSVVEPIRETWYQNIIRRDGHPAFMFARGCHRSCHYCSNQAVRKTLGLTPGYRYKTPTLAIAEINSVRSRFSFKKIHFHDDCFAVSKKWRSNFLGLYSKLIGMQFSCNVSPELATQRYLSELRDAGCQAIVMGVECGDEVYRRNVLSHMSNACILKAFREAKRLGLKTVALNMIGLPDETNQQLQSTV